MRILLVQNAPYIPTHGGANKVTRAVLEGLAERGHVCRAVVRAHSLPTSAARAQLLAALADRKISVSESTNDAVIFRHSKVEVHGVADVSKLRGYVSRQVVEFEPDWNLVASEDPGQTLLQVCISRAVYLAQTTLFLPFGPGAFMTSVRGRDLVLRAAGIITTSEYLKDYLHRWGQARAEVIRPPIFGNGPFPRFSSRQCGYITLINPCAYKGISIFTEIAERLPELAFAAVSGWGTTREDESSLRRFKNICLLQSVDDIRDVLRQTRVLLVPSLWPEAFGCVAIEAMLHGIPVLASNVGGLPEAKLGVPYILPVRPIARYSAHFDECLKPVPVIPDQDCRPWLQAIKEILSSDERYDDIATASQMAAVKAVSSMTVAPFEDFLQMLG